MEKKAFLQTIVKYFAGKKRKSVLMTLIQNEESQCGYVNDENCSLVFDLSQQVKVFIKKKKKKILERITIQ